MHPPKEMKSITPIRILALQVIYVSIDVFLLPATSSTNQSHKPRLPRDGIARIVAQPRDSHWRSQAVSQWVVTVEPKDDKIKLGQEIAIIPDDGRGRFSGITGTVQHIRALERDYVSFYVVNFDRAVAELSTPIFWANLSSFRLMEHELLYHSLPNVLATLFPVPQMQNTEEVRKG